MNWHQVRLIFVSIGIVAFSPPDSLVNRNIILVVLQRLNELEKEQKEAEAQTMIMKKQSKRPSKQQR